MDLTVVVTAAITGCVGLAGAAIQARLSRQQLRASEQSKIADEVSVRRLERREVYVTMLDLLSDFSWDGAGEDVVDTFSKPFVRVATRVRIQGSPAAIAALDEVQYGLAMFNAVGDPPIEKELDAAWKRIGGGTDAFYAAAREEFGPRPEDGLRAVEHRSGGGPPA